MAWSQKFRLTPATIIDSTEIYPCSYLRNDSCYCRNWKVTPGPGFHKFLTSRLVYERKTQNPAGVGTPNPWSVATSGFKVKKWLNRDGFCKKIDKQIVLFSCSVTRSIKNRACACHGIHRRYCGTNQRCHFWCCNIRFDVFRNFFDVWCLRYKFDVENDFPIVSNSFLIFTIFQR